MTNALLRLADRLAARAGLLDRSFPAARLLARAGLADDPELAEALGRLLDACAAESALSVVGRIATAWDTSRLLGNLARLAAEEARDPGVLAEPLSAPIFITGLPRSGTSFLHRLLLEDPDNHAPRVWQTIAPYPQPGRPDRRIAAVERQLAAFARLAPEFPGLHPLSATSPQECSEIGAHVFRSLRFDTTYHMPSYRAWLDAGAQLPAYRFQRRFLQHLQHQRPAGAAPGRWVLKCPDHVFALAELREAFPDARLVFVHRDPVSVVLSVARLTEVLRRPFTRRIDRLAIGRHEAARWHDGAARMIRAAADPRICHIHYQALTADPLGTARQVYRHFGLRLPASAKAAIARMAAREPNGGYAHEAYRFADYGLDPAAERARFGDYTRFFDIATEDGPPRRVAPMLPRAA